MCKWFFFYESNKYKKKKLLKRPYKTETERINEYYITPRHSGR